MKIWEVKAQALRLMFADTDVEFSQSEFADGSIYENSNTRDKLVRMEDSIRRAIDLFYHYVRTETLVKTFVLDNEIEDGETVYQNKIDLSADPTIGFPTRVDAYVYHTINEVPELRGIKNQINYVFQKLNGRIEFLENWANLGGNVEFKIFYRVAKTNVPASVDEMTYDLDVIEIPPDVQRMIPYFIKAELYEEDEPNIASDAKRQFISFLYGYKRPFDNVQTKVKRPKIFDK